MRKKQFYAILLAGALAAGSVPTIVWAAEDTAATAQTAVSDKADDSSEGNTEPLAEETPAAETQPESTQTPEEENPVPVTETPAEAIQDSAAGQTGEAPAETMDAAVGDTQTPGTLSEVPSAVPSETPEPSTAPVQEDTGIYIETAADGAEPVKKYYKTLQEAVDAAFTTVESSETTVIKFSQMLSLSSTIDVSGKKICLMSVAADAKIVRQQGFVGDLFSLSGEGSELQFAADEGCTFTVDASGTENITGSIVNVSDNAAFGMSSGVALTGNSTSANGGAVMNNGGSIVLKGGSVTGNGGAKGAVYTNSNVMIQGSVSVKDNTGANFYLDGDAAFIVTGTMSDSSIAFTDAGAADQKVVIRVGNAETGTQLTEEDFKTAVGQFSYDNQDYSIVFGSDGLSAVLKQGEAETPMPTVSPSVTPSVTVTPSPIPTTTPSASFLAYQSGSLKWVDHNTISVGMSTTKDCKWYYFFVDADTSTSVIQGMYDSSRAVNSAGANTTFTIKVENVPEEDSWLVVAAEPTSGNVQMRVLKLNSTAFKNKRPVASPSESTRAPRTYSVSESTVTGLEEPLKFYPNTFYEFQVIGAGQNDEAPYVSGDERWIPMYWSTAQNPTNDQKNTTWRIGSGGGITQAATYNMYIFFKKQVYNGSEWTDTDVIESIVTQFRSAEITDNELAELTATPGVDYGNGTTGYSAELTATASASYKDGASDTKSAVYTADTSPVGTMSALAALSLAAGGYILVRKRKKES